MLGSVSFGCVRCLRYMLARRVCRRQAPPEATGRNLWKGTQTCFGGGVHTLKRRVSGFREGERASEGRGCTWRGTLNARQKGKPEGSLPVNGSLMARDCRKPIRTSVLPSEPEEEREGNWPHWSSTARPNLSPLPWFSGCSQVVLKDWDRGRGSRLRGHVQSVRRSCRWRKLRHRWRCPPQPVGPRTW